MKEIENYKYLFLKRMYELLGLKDLEKKFPEVKIHPLKVEPNEEYDLISPYFFLLNEVHLESLNPEQLEKFRYYFSKKPKDLSSQELDEIMDFMKETYPLLLFPKGDMTYVYYGPINDDYCCPRDAIALGLYYDAFASEEDFEIENHLADVVNCIQSELAPQIGEKVAVIPFNQLTLENKIEGFAK